MDLKVEGSIYLAVGIAISKRFLTFILCAQKESPLHWFTWITRKLTFQKEMFGSSNTIQTLVEEVMSSPQMI